MYDGITGKLNILINCFFLSILPKLHLLFLCLALKKCFLNVLTGGNDQNNLLQQLIAALGGAAANKPTGFGGKWKWPEFVVGDTSTKQFQSDLKLR